MPENICDGAKPYFDQITQILGQTDSQAIDAFAGLLHDAWRDDRQVFVMGNGGSAFTASHHVCDYVKTAAVDGQRRLRAISLVDNTGLITALGNDISYDDIFRYTLESYGKAGDLAIAISCSGNSPNVLEACRWAKDNGLTVVVLTGFAGGKLKDLSHLHINVPSDNYGVIEDVHMSIGHIAAQMLKTRVMSEAAIA